MCSSALTKDLYLVSAVAGGWIHFPTGRRTEKRQQIFHNVAAARDKPLFQVGREKVSMLEQKFQTRIDVIFFDRIQSL